MLTILKDKLNILSCSRSLTGNFKFKLLFPSEINDKWLSKRIISKKIASKYQNFCTWGDLEKKRDI